MYTKEEASAIRQQFWTSMGQYLAPIPSASGSKVNWINYKTGIKAIRFKMDANSKSAYIAIQIDGKDEETHTAYYKMMRSFKTELEAATGEAWTWEEEFVDEYNKAVSRVYIELEPVNIFNKDDWPKLISFFKARLVALDLFWTAHKDFFEMIA